MPLSKHTYQLLMRHPELGPLAGLACIALFLLAWALVEALLGGGHSAGMWPE